ncbi:hypothetical protein M413DRAFT_29989 [Hebeloma cylindrosporum]|uniref:KOW domain-containing protein n=1 Tax=Hebeloma cylindrosporum TaxID=76867 RepID=A0A0C3C3B9_HEBCY|nr:hypothetical protein M413DRAFT_29984 [Hebeloma cylindrosporum h7]KIM38759.1 hypothetical protein M413DRAFT_29989 [Hebeloma cylindrosporum h7]
MKENPHKRLIGKQVMVIGANVYKGAKGIIRDVTPAGDASVFLDIFNEKSPRIFKISNLCLVHGNTLQSFKKDKKTRLPQLEAPAATPTPATPMPPEEEQTHDADAWDPNSSAPVPNPETPYWLSDEAFRGIRVKLRYCSPPSPPFLEFGGMEEGSAKRYHPPGMATL